MTTPTPVLTLTKQIEAGASAQQICSHLDALAAHERVREVLALPGSLFEQLYVRVQGHGAITVEELVPDEDATVIYALKNNLPFFKFGEKRFFRKKGESTAIGYNHQTAFVTFFAGPGDFLALNGDGGEIIFDYPGVERTLKAKRTAGQNEADVLPAGWPRNRWHHAPIGALVYGNMIDRVRRVSNHTVIGAAFNADGKSRKAYFILTRALAPDQAA